MSDQERTEMEVTMATLCARNAALEEELKQTRADQLRSVDFITQPRDVQVSVYRGRVESDRFPVTVSCQVHRNGKRYVVAYAFHNGAETQLTASLGEPEDADLLARTEDKLAQEAGEILVNRVT